jgi:cytochrome c oxidase subunit 4
MSTQALSNPTLSNIEKRWEGMPLQEQADLWMALRDRMKGSWKELTLQEKKAGRCATMLCENPSGARSLAELLVSSGAAAYFSSQGPTSAH